MNQYTADTLIRMTVSFVTAVTNTYADPTTVTMKIKLPDDSIVDLSGSVVKTSVGNYYTDYVPLTVGLHMYEWIGAGAVKAAIVQQFNVNQGTF